MQHFACEGVKYLNLNPVLIIRADQYCIIIYIYIYMTFVVFTGLFSQMMPQQRHGNDW